uniref:Uncharacterized protein n=1 Tax=Rhizophagus irregularis (strain DAOM 181602 / DAOM 197198 / MUCL 43194) TaxID=747089 RepID=U9TTV6_RHIID
MELSLNCFVLGSRNTFTANVPKKYINEIIFFFHFDEDIGIGLIQDKTTEYLQELLCPFDEPVDFFEFLPGVMLTVGNAMKLYKGKKNQEMETSYMVDNVIRKMLKLADKYIGTFGLEWARNNKTNDFTTTTDNLSLGMCQILCVVSTAGFTDVIFRNQAVI